MLESARFFGLLCGPGHGPGFINYGPKLEKNGNNLLIIKEKMVEKDADLQLRQLVSWAQPASSTEWDETSGLWNHPLKPISKPVTDIRRPDGPVVRLNQAHL